MFHKLRNHLVTINAIITSIVLVVAFMMIYIVAQSSTMKRPLPRGGGDFSQRDNQIMEERIQSERQAALDSLLVSLIAIGTVVELAVITVSYYLAEIAIKPVREAYETQKVFIANASHEIKTPLAAISANLEAAEIEDNKWINNISKEVQLLMKLNQELLELARVDNATRNTKERTVVEVGKVFDEVVVRFASRTKEKELKVMVQPKNARVEVVKEDLQQILTILIDNAIKYSDKKIVIEYYNREIYVSNDGVVVSNERLKHVFERFYQVDKTAEGAGLGLAIAKKLAEQNGWKLSLESSSKTEQNTRACLRFR